MSDIVERLEALAEILSFENTNSEAGFDKWCLEAADEIKRLRQDRDGWMPDWPPARSAIDLPDGERRHGSTGQLFEVKGGQWVRVPE